MQLIDTHTHIYYEKNPKERADMMQRCKQHHIEKLFLPNVDSASIPLIQNILDEYPEHCFAMLGLHPCDVKENFEDELATIALHLDQMKIYAIGEIGIDLYWDKSTLQIQKEAFITQIRWAKERNLPINIHCRDAFDEVYEILLSEKNEALRGIFHCFGGSVAQAQKLIALGFYLGIGGIVTYKNSGLDKVIAEIGIEKVVLETDAPYLTPVPFRGKPNESSYLVHIAEKIATVLNTSLPYVARITTQNALTIYQF